MHLIIPQKFTLVFVEQTKTTHLKKDGENDRKGLLYLRSTKESEDKEQTEKREPRTSRMNPRGHNRQKKTCEGRACEIYTFFPGCLLRKVPSFSHLSFFPCVSYVTTYSPPTVLPRNIATMLVNQKVMFFTNKIILIFTINIIYSAD